MGRRRWGPAPLFAKAKSPPEYFWPRKIEAQIPVSMIAFASMGTVRAFNPAMFIRLSPTM